MGVRIRIRGKSIHLVIRWQGTYHAEATGLHLTGNDVQDKEVMRLAEVLRSRREIQLVEGLNGVSLADVKKTLYEYTEAYSNERGHEAQIYKVLPYLKQYGGDAILVSAVTPQWYERFQIRMEKDSGLALNTAEKYSAVVRMVLKKATRDGLLRRDPSEGIRHIRTPESMKEHLTAEEVAAMVRTPYVTPKMDPALQDDIRRAFIFSCYTGLRVSDMTALVWKDIDMAEARIVKRQVKTKKVVIIPLSQPAMEILKAGDMTGKYCFPQLSLTRTTTNRYISGWAAAAGITKHVTWHTARHTDATLLLEYGADLYTVQKLLGHTKISTTAQYARLTDKAKRDAVDALPDYGKIV